MISQDVEWPQVASNRCPLRTARAEKEERALVGSQKRDGVPGSQAAVAKGLFVLPRHRAGAILSLQLTLATTACHGPISQFRAVSPPPTSPQGLNLRHGLPPLLSPYPSPELIPPLPLRGLEI